MKLSHKAILKKGAHSLHKVLIESTEETNHTSHQSMDYKSRRLEMTSMSIKRGPVEYVRNTKQPLKRLL